MRWISVDMFQVSQKHINNPQKWNYFNYTLSNPILYYDPSGMDEVTDVPYILAKAYWCYKLGGAGTQTAEYGFSVAKPKSLKGKATTDNKIYSNRLANTTRIPLLEEPSAVVHTHPNIKSDNPSGEDNKLHTKDGKKLVAYVVKATGITKNDPKTGAAIPVEDSSWVERGKQEYDRLLADARKEAIKKGEDPDKVELFLLNPPRDTSPSSSATTTPPPTPTK